MSIGRLFVVSFVLALHGAPQTARAQTDLVFTNSQLSLAEPARITPSNDIEVFKGGDAVWCVLRTNDNASDISGYTSVRNGVRVVMVLIGDFRDVGGGARFIPVDSVAFPVSPEQLRRSSFSFPVIPESFDIAAPGLERMLSKFDEFNKRRALVAVVIRADIERNTIRSGFYVDLSNGLGRYAEWRAKVKAVYAARVEELERPRLSERASWFASYATKRRDDAFDRALAAWWKTHAAPGNQLLQTRTASPDWNFVRSDVGVVLSRRLTVLYVFRNGGNGNCFLVWRQFGYESLGAGVFDTELKAWDPSGVTFRSGKEELDPNRGYELDCAPVVK